MSESISIFTIERSYSSSTFNWLRLVLGCPRPRMLFPIALLNEQTCKGVERRRASAGDSTISQTLAFSLRGAGLLVSYFVGEELSAREDRRTSKILRRLAAC